MILDPILPENLCGRDCLKLVGGLKYSSETAMARSEVERAASPFHVEPAGGRLYIPTD